MKVWITSKSSNQRFALEEGNVIAVCYSGPYPLDDAKSYALDHTRATEENTFVYEVELTPCGSYKTTKEVVFVPAGPPRTAGPWCG